MDTQPLNVYYGELWYNSKSKVIRAYDGDKWVTYEETDDPVLKYLLEPSMDALAAKEAMRQ